MNKELKFDHFKNIEELLQHIDIWYKEDDIDYTRWFGLNDLYTLSNYITNLQQENKQLKEQLEYLRSNEYLNQVKWERNFNEELVKDLQQENKQLKEDIVILKKLQMISNDILSELEEWLEMMEEKETIGTYSMIQDKIQELKEKYK